jgi:transcriptional regulator
MDILSRRIKELREEHFLSQKALAQRVGVTQKAIDFWEKGQNEPKATYLKNLALTFNVKAGYLLGLENRDD